MTDHIVPGWIKEIQERRARDSARTQYEAQQSVLAAKMIHADGPEFWKQLLKELSVTVDSLHLIGMRASISDLGPKYGGCRISVSRDSTFPGHTYIDLFYDGLGSNPNHIRCQPLRLKPFDLRFCVSNDQVMVQDEDSNAPMSPERAARHIIEPLVEELNS